MDWKTVLSYAVKVVLILTVLHLVQNAQKIGRFISSKLPVSSETSLQAVGERLGALVASLPFVTILILVGLWAAREGNQKIANHAWYTFWFVIPTLPMFLLMAWMMNKGLGFWVSLTSGVVLTCVCFVLTAVIGKKFGVVLW